MTLIGGSVTLSIPVIQLGSLLVGVPNLRYWQCSNSPVWVTDISESRRQSVTSEQWKEMYTTTHESKLQHLTFRCEFKY